MIGKSKEVVLEAKNIRKYFTVTKGIIFSRIIGWIKAVDDISFRIRHGETFGLAGESGCGKTTTARLIWLLERLTNGSLLFRGRDVKCLSLQELRLYRASVQAVFQDPFSSLSPRMKIGEIVAEPLIVNSTLSRKQIEHRVAEVFDQVALDANCGTLYPHEFSGGQRQRIAIARALSTYPELILLDEPVSALDVSIRADVMNLLKSLQGMRGMSYLLIAHDLATIRYMSHHTAIMYLGKIVELTESEELFTNPLHPYTQALLSAALPLHPDVRRGTITLSGEVPSALNPPKGCRFHQRCLLPIAICSNEEPALREIIPDHWVACHKIIP